MAEIDIPFPIEGRDDSMPLGKQVPSTTASCENVRGWDPASGRMRGGMRPALAKANTQPLGASGRVQALATTVYDANHVTYTVRTSAAEGWAYTGAEDGASDVAVDEFGTRYVLDGGKSVVVLNALGVEVQRISPPIGQGQVCRCLEVDPATLRVYVGTSEGGTVQRARLWCFTKDPYLGYVQTWELDVGGFVGAIVIRGDRLFVAVNEVDPVVSAATAAGTGRAFVKAFQLVASEEPIEVWQADVPAPVMDMDVAATGNVAVCTDFRSDRAKDPTRSQLGQRLERGLSSWWIDDITDYKKRAWTIFDPAKLDMKTGDSVANWDDFNGSARSLYAPTSESVVLENVHITLGNSQPANGVYIEFSLGDGSVVERYTWVDTIAAAGDVDRGNSLGDALANLYYAMSGTGTAGSDYHIDTQPSTLAKKQDIAIGWFKIDCNTQRSSVFVYLSSGANIQIIGGGGRITSTTGHIYPGKTVVVTAPTFKESGSLGRPCVYFNGTSDKLVTLSNPNHYVENAAQQHTVLPSYGNNFSSTASAGFAIVMAVRPYYGYEPSVILRQPTYRFGRTLAVNTDTNGAYNHKYVALYDKLDGDNASWHARSISAMGDPDLLIISIRSEPATKGLLSSVWKVNGLTVFRSTDTQRAEANDGNARTVIGQSSDLAIRGHDRFCEMEIYGIAVLNDVGGVVTDGFNHDVARMEAAFAYHFGVQSQLFDFSLGSAFLMSVATTGTISMNSDPGWEPKSSVVFSGISLPPELANNRTVWVESVNGLNVTLTADGVNTLTFASPGSYSNVTITTVHPYAFEPPPPEDVTSRGTWHLAREALSYYPIVTKLDKLSGEVSWMLTSQDNTTGSVGGLGLGVAWNSDGNLYSAGYPVDMTTDSASVRMIVDQGDTYSIDPADGAGAWSYTIGTLINETFAAPARMRLAVDRWDNLFVPFNNPNLSTKYWMWFFEKDGTAETFTVSPEGAFYAIAVDPFESDYTTNPTPITRPLRVTIAGLHNGRAAVDLRLVDAASNSRGREHVWVGVADGAVKTFTASNVSTVTDLDSGTSLNPSARYVHAAALYGRVFFTDGVTIKHFDARANTVQNYKPTSSGMVPEAVRIIETYSGALVFTGGPDAHNWFMTSREDPFDLDYYPGVATDTQAVNGSLGPPGRLPDVISGFVPIFDDLAIFLCDHHVYRMTGDPMSPGCRFDPISDAVGGAFGRAWALGPDSVPFFWGQRGGLYAISGGTRVEPVSGRKLDVIMREIDLTKFFVRMAWNTRYDGMEIYLCPFGGVSDRGRSFFWERSTDAFWEENFSNTNLDVTDVIAVDGDAPDDRKMLVGCRDGYVRTWSDTGSTDDGYAINSRVRIGPIVVDQRYETKLRRLIVVLEQTLGVARVRLFSSDAPGDPGDVVQTFTLVPGLTTSLPARVRGGYLWIEIQSQSRWAFEAMRAAVSLGSYRRIRS